MLFLHSDWRWIIALIVAASSAYLMYYLNENKYSIKGARINNSFCHNDLGWVACQPIKLI